MLHFIFNLSIVKMLKIQDRKLTALVSFLFIGIIVLSIFAILNFLQEAYSVVIFDVVLLALCFFFFYLLSKKYDIEKIITFVTIILFIALVVFLFISKGIGYTLVWSLSYPFVAMILNGTKRGVYYTSTFFLVNCLIVYNFIGESLTIESYIRFISMLMSLTVIAYFYEQTTQSSLKRLNDSIQDVEDLNKELEKRIQREIKKSKKKDLLLFEQSKMAAMGEMLANIAHQWRQPLSIISTASTGAKLQKEMDCLSDEELNKSLTSINETAQYLSKTIDDFRSFFNPINNKSNEFEISNTISKTLQLIDSQFTAKDIEIIQNIEEYKLLSIENELIQVLINILNNARDALVLKENQKRLIFINTYKKDDISYIEILDNAGGIEESIINRIFEPYYTTKHQSVGTGIGLYMSKEIVHKHLHGSLNVSNDTYIYEGFEYIGASFVIKVPID